MLPRKLPKWTLSPALPFHYLATVSTGCGGREMGEAPCPPQGLPIACWLGSCGGKQVGCPWQGSSSPPAMSLESYSQELQYGAAQPGFLLLWELGLGGEGSPSATQTQPSPPETPASKLWGGPHGTRAPFPFPFSAEPPVNNSQKLQHRAPCLGFLLH